MLFKRKEESKDSLRENLENFTTKDLMSAILRHLENSNIKTDRKEWVIYIEIDNSKVGIVFFKEDPYYLAITECIPFEEEDSELVGHWTNIVASNTKLISYSIEHERIMLKSDSQIFSYKDVLLTFTILLNTLTDTSKKLKKKLSFRTNPSVEPESGNIEDDFEKGKTELSRKRPKSAINYFKRVYYLFNRLFLAGEMNDRGYELYYESAYFIGYAFMELDSFDEAYRYLETASKGPLRKAKYIKEFAHCLTCLKDSKRMEYVDYQLKELEKRRLSAWDEEDSDLYYYLWKRKVYILVDLKEFDLAEELLRELAADDVNNKIIWNEIDYVKKVKRQSMKNK